MPRQLLMSWLVFLGTATATIEGSEVSGRVEMPETCSPSASPAVVRLEPADRSARAPKADPATVSLVRQAGLLFQPRIQAMTLGQALRFTNEDGESHSVHNVGAGDNFSIHMAPGQPHEIVPGGPGVLKLVCDIHSHMRGYVVVDAWPWHAVCGRDGRFRIADVPDGRYFLHVWHEMGDPLRREVVVSGQAVDVGTLEVTGPAIATRVGEALPVRPWPEVVDRIGMTLTASLDAARRPAESRRARALAEDAYFAEFEASDMETAVRRYLGLERAGELEGRFRKVIREVRQVAEGKLSPPVAGDSVRHLIQGIWRAADDLNKMGVVDRTTIDVASHAEAHVEARSEGDRRALLAALDRALDGVRALADRGEKGEAVSAMTDVYFDAFEPLERELELGDPLIVPRLEARFNALRGELGTGLRGEALASRMASLHGEVERALSRSEAASLGAFGTAFGVSLVTILREGVEVILLLTMLIALVAKAGLPGQMAAIRRGVGLAAVASLATALGLNLMLASSRGRSRELLEGLVMLAASGVLFYVSYWLISRSEARRWADFLKRQVRQGAESGSAWTLGLTAFLAVYREGAETALMYQAMISGQSSRLGYLGLAVGLGVGLVLLALIYRVIRTASVRLPLQAFFKVSGLVLFAMAVVFAGNGVAELQVSGLIKTTPLPWLGEGLPTLGLYPNVQAVSIQALLLSGAVLALMVLLFGGQEVSPGDRSRARNSTVAPETAAGAGA